MARIEKLIEKHKLNVKALPQTFAACMRWYGIKGDEKYLAKATACVAVAKHLKINSLCSMEQELNKITGSEEEAIKTKLEQEIESLINVNVSHWHVSRFHLHVYAIDMLVQEYYERFNCFFPEELEKKLINIMDKYEFVCFAKCINTLPSSTDKPPQEAPPPVKKEYNLMPMILILLSCLFLLVAGLFGGVSFVGLSIIPLIPVLLEGLSSVINSGACW